MLCVLGLVMVVENRPHTWDALEGCATTGETDGERTLSMQQLARYLERKRFAWARVLEIFA
jgi:hypothetical protein